MMAWSSDWAGLPMHLLDMILGKVVSFSDYLHFSAACTSWYCATMENHGAREFYRPVPLLLLPKRGEENGELKSLYDVTTKRFLNLEVRVPHNSNTRYSGSSRGWIIAVGDDYNITLTNPMFLEPVVHLPPILKDLTDHTIQIRKAILSGDPITEAEDYIVAVIYGDRAQLAFIQPGRFNYATDWTFVSDRMNVLEDILFYHTWLLAVDYAGNVYSFDVFDNTNEFISRKLAPALEGFYNQGRRYLVESLDGDLLLVLRRVRYSFDESPDDDFNPDDPRYRNTWQVDVFKWNLSEPNWVKMESLGNSALFLGDNMSVVVLASDFPGCCPNSIYLTQCFDYIIIVGHFGPRDCGVYNLEHGSFEPHYVTDEASWIAMTEQPPIWFVPKLQN